MYHQLPTSGFVMTMLVPGPMVHSCNFNVAVARYYGGVAGVWMPPEWLGVLVYMAPSPLSPPPQKKNPKSLKGADAVD
jgi:hypothetical protein